MSYDISYIIRYNTIWPINLSSQVFQRFKRLLPDWKEKESARWLGIKDFFGRVQPHMISSRRRRPLGYLLSLDQNVKQIAQCNAEIAHVASTFKFDQVAFVACTLPTLAVPVVAPMLFLFFFTRSCDVSSNLRVAYAQKNERSAGYCGRWG